MNNDISTAAAALGSIGGKSTSLKKGIASRKNGALGGRPAIIPIVMQNGSVKGCNYIYAPKGQAFEYAPLAANPYRGCGHKCAYCYVPNILRMKRKDFDSGATERPGFIEGLKRDAKKYKKAGVTSQVMLSFTSDPYHRGNTNLTRETLKILINETNLGFCTLTKGGTRSLRDIDLFRSNKDSFGTTLTSLDDSFSKKWESGAALPSDRINAIREFHNNGIYTWVSLEPTLDTDASVAIIRKTHKFVNLFKIGRANYLPMTKTTDWKAYTHQIIDICQSLNIEHYIKLDLQPYLPDGYHNPLRRNQHF